MERKELIKICEAAIVQQDKWSDRDSYSAQSSVGKCWALLKAGCKYVIKTKENTNPKDSCITDDNTIWIQFTVKNFNWFENSFDAEEDNPDGYVDYDAVFYLPTRQRLKENKGKDWY